MDNDKKKKKVALVDNYDSDENKDENKNEGKEESKVEPNSKNVLLSVFWVKTLKNFKKLQKRAIKLGANRYIIPRGRIGSTLILLRIPGLSYPQGQRKAREISV